MLKVPIAVAATQPGISKSADVLVADSTAVLKTIAFQAQASASSESEPQDFHEDEMNKKTQKSEPKRKLKCITKNSKKARKLSINVLLKISKENHYT